MLVSRQTDVSQGNPDRPPNRACQLGSQSTTECFHCPDSPVQKTTPVTDDEGAKTACEARTGPLAARTRTLVIGGRTLIANTNPKANRQNLQDTHANRRGLSRLQVRKIWVVPVSTQPHESTAPLHTLSYRDLRSLCSMVHWHSRPAQSPRSTGPGQLVQ